MFIEIRRASFVNKGSDLMLESILSILRNRYPDAKFVMATNMREAPYEKRAIRGFYQKLHISRYGLQIGILVELIPKGLRRSMGLILDKEIDVVIDAAGFAYGQQWGYKNCIELAQSCERWKKHGTKVILLPQAFGPFEYKKIQKPMAKAVANIDIVFAREEESLSHLKGLSKGSNNILLKPDFTNLQAGELPDWFDADLHQVCLIPNYRMIDKTDSTRAKAYIDMMVKCANYFINNGLKPFVLIHGGDEDLKLARQINRAVRDCMPVLVETNPLKIKGAIGASRGMIGSRFHGLVSALSQAVPSLGTSWSHKYKMLFKDYDYSEGLVDVFISKEELEAKLELFVEPVKYEDVKKRLKNRSEYLKKQSEEMWQKVFEVIDRT